MFELVRVFFHTAELWEKDGLEVLPHPFVAVKYGSAARTLYGDRQNEKDGAQKDHRQKGRDDVEEPLEKTIRQRRSFFTRLAHSAPPPQTAGAPLRDVVVFFCQTWTLRWKSFSYKTNERRRL